MKEARDALEITRRMHALAASPEGVTLTLAELERLALESLAEEREEPDTHDSPG